VLVKDKSNVLTTASTPPFEENVALLTVFNPKRMVVEDRFNHRICRAGEVNSGTPGFGEPLTIGGACCLR
jgi:hypothetical protein